ncbi:MAG TPA: GNAT family N-acetyltransferase [Dehalococcoidia bacterium]
MGLEIRPIREEERARRAFVSSAAFATEERFRATQPGWEPPLDWTLAAFVEGEMAACLIVIPFNMWINGGPITIGGVADVSCLPEYRRQGLTGALLRRALEQMRERGQPLSALFTPHVPLYRRYGWEPASLLLWHRFAAKQAALREPLPAAGRLMRVSPGDWPRLDAIWRRFIARQNCLLERSEEWWRDVVFEVRDGIPQRDLIAWTTDVGAIEGWIGYREYDERPARRGTRLVVRELVAETPSARRQLLGFLLRHDRALEIQLSGAEDDPLWSLLADPYVVETRASERLLLRIVDLPGALAARPSLAQEPLAVSVELLDRDCPWNAGVWRIAADGGRMQAERACGDADLAVGVNTLALLYNGYRSASWAAAAGLIDVHEPAALARLDALFAVDARPSTIDGF